MHSPKPAVSLRPGRTDSDQMLVARVQRGDKTAFDVLVRKYQHKIVKLVTRYVHDSSEALDVAQEAFIKAYRALPGFRGDSAFYTWLYRIGINTAKNHLLANKRRAPTSTPFDVDEAESFEDAGLLHEVSTPENELMSKQVVDVVQTSLQQLPEDLRSALTLREIEGLSYEEIASVMNCPIGTVRSRIFRAREAVAENLRPLLETSKGNRW